MSVLDELAAHAAKLAKGADEPTSGSPARDMAGLWVPVTHSDRPASGASVRLSKDGLAWFGTMDDSDAMTCALMPTVHGTVLAVYTDRHGICCWVCSNHPEWANMRFAFVHLLQLKCGAVEDVANSDADGTHDGDADPRPGRQADRHADRHTDGRADGHADRHADGHADAGVGGAVVGNAGAHVYGECTGQEQA